LKLSEAIQVMKFVMLNYILSEKSVFVKFIKSAMFAFYLIMLLPKQKNSIKDFILFRLRIEVFLSFLIVFKRKKIKKLFFC